MSNATQDKSRPILLRAVASAAMAAGLVLGFISLERRDLRQDVIELIRISLWPAVALCGLIFLGDSLIEFFKSVALRVNKFSIFKIDFELKAAGSLVQSPLKGLADLRAPLAAAVAGDSSGSLSAALGEAAASDYVVIDLGSGNEWLASRVFILVALLGRLRGLRCVVFVETIGGESRRIVGTASPEQVRWMFAMRWPFLEEAFVRAENSARYAEPYGQTNIISVQGAVSGDVAQEIFQRFLNGQPAWAAQSPNSLPWPGLHSRAGLPPGSAPDEWVKLSDPANPEAAAWERAEWVTGDMLRVVLREVLTREILEEDPGDPAEKFARAVVLAPARFVVLVDKDRQFRSLVDRLAIADCVAVAYARNAGEQP